MDTSTYRPLRMAAALFHITSLELAPKGWRRCVEHVAAGVSRKDDDKDLCLLCGKQLDGVQGHDAGCLTMIARRILANEPLLHAQRLATQADVDIDTTRGDAGAAIPPRSKPSRSTNGYVIPRFLAH
jgi:hypothetical protein